MFCCSPPGSTICTNDFPLHPIFVPFVEQTALYLSGTERRSRRARSVDSFLELRSSKEQSVGVEVIDPQGHRPLSLQDSTIDADSIQLTAAPGFYELKLASGRHDVIGVERGLRRESNLETIPDDDVLALWRRTKFRHRIQRRPRLEAPPCNRTRRLSSHTVCGGIVVCV